CHQPADGAVREDDVEMAPPDTSLDLVSRARESLEPARDLTRPVLRHGERVQPGRKRLVRDVSVAQDGGHWRTRSCEHGDVHPVPRKLGDVIRALPFRATEAVRRQEVQHMKAHEVLPAGAVALGEPRRKPRAATETTPMTHTPS